MPDVQNQTRGEGWSWGESGKEIKKAYGQLTVRNGKNKDFRILMEEGEKAMSTIKALLF
jgi:hypothetical protein